MKPRWACKVHCWDRRGEGGAGVLSSKVSGALTLRKHSPLSPLTVFAWDFLDLVMLKYFYFWPVGTKLDPGFSSVPFMCLLFPVSHFHVCACRNTEYKRAYLSLLFTLNKNLRSTLMCVFYLPTPWHKTYTVHVGLCGTLCWLKHWVHSGQNPLARVLECFTFHQHVCLQTFSWWSSRHFVT